MILIKTWSVLIGLTMSPSLLLAEGPLVLEPNQLIACKSEAAVFERIQELNRSTIRLSGDCRVVTATDDLQMLGTYKEIYSFEGNFFLAYRQVQVSDSEIPEYLILLLETFSGSP